MRKMVLFSITIIGLFFLFGPEVTPDNFQPQEVLVAVKDSDVVIIFNSGGWGDTPLEEAYDFAPVITGIQKTLSDQGYNSVVIPFYRTKNNFWGRVSGAKDFFSFYNLSSRILAEDLEFLTENLPDKKIILAGLSDGAAFINKTYEKTSERVRKSVFTIVAGTPFWSDTLKSDNVLALNNKGGDSLTEGRAGPLFSALFRAPFQYISSKLNGQNLSLARAFSVAGHDYKWDSSEVNEEIVAFLKSKFRN